jgi:GDP-L-fucose synthase
MPTNLYGPNDNFDLQSSHVLPALIRKFHEAKQRDDEKVVIWGTGKQRREFLYVGDMADACVYVMNEEGFTNTVNIGIGKDIEIGDLAKLIADVIGYKGILEFDKEKPDGTPQKLLDVSRLSSLGWQAKTSLIEGVKQTYKWFLNNQEDLRN